MWFEGGEGIIGNLRPRRGNPRDQRGFAGVRESHQAHVGQQPEFQPQVPLLAGLALFGLAWRLMPGLGEMLVATPSAAAPGHGPLLSRPRQVSQPLAALFVDYRGPDRNRQ